MILPDPPTPPTDLAVVGEHKHDPDQLLLRGEDGRYYAYSLPDDDTTLVEPDDDWDIEPIADEELFT